MKPHIVLHVGAPKTGSTYIQRRLVANREIFRRHGTYVPQIPAVAAMAGNAKLLATALNASPTPSFARIFPHIDAAALDPGSVVDTLLADWRPREERVVLSAENLRPRHAEQVRALLPDWADVRVVLFVRRQDHWAASYFNQLRKTQDLADGASRFVERLCSGAEAALCRPDWIEHLQAWRSAFGDCRVVLYDEVKDSLFGAFARAGDLALPAVLEDIPAAQELIDIFSLAWLLTLPPTTAHDDFLAQRAAARRAASLLKVDREVRSALSAADLGRIRDRFSDSNRRLLDLIERPDAGALLDLDTHAPAGFDLAAFLASPRFRAFAEAVREARAEAEAATPAEPARSDDPAHGGPLVMGGGRRPGGPAGTAREPISFVTVVNDWGEFEHNLRASAAFGSPAHERVVIDNVGNAASPHICALYRLGLHRARNDLVFFIHPDVYLPQDWEEDLFRSLDRLESLNPAWGVLGAAGALPLGAPEAGRGHWSDPHVPEGIFLGPLPCEVFALDECWLGLRRSRGLSFDAAMPGFHCYGIDLCLSARQAGLGCYAIDALVRHKLKDSTGAVIASAADSQKIVHRGTPEFERDYRLSHDYVRGKWRSQLPMRDMSSIYLPFSSAVEADPRR